ncbi:MAG TPA: glyoxalase, partial [Nocardioides sp.]
MFTLETITIDATDATDAQAFYEKAFGLTDQISVRQGPGTGTGRPFTISLVVSQPSTVDSLVDSALTAGATSLKPVEKSFWGYGGIVQAPDGSIWKIATSAKKDNGPATREIDDIVLLLGVADVKATKRFYAERGLGVKRSFGGKYAEFEA